MLNDHFESTMNSNSDQKTKYPDWPTSFKGYGDNLQWPDLSHGPDPQEVREWQRERKATVSQVCEYFCLSRVQVMKCIDVVALSRL